MKDTDPWNLESEHDPEKKMEFNLKKVELDFVEVINLIIRYYHPTCEYENLLDPSESWKKKDNDRKVPDDLDHLVKRSFMRELRKFN